MLISTLKMLLLFTCRWVATHRETFRNLRVRVQRRLRQTDIIEEAVSLLRVLYSLFFIFVPTIAFYTAMLKMDLKI
jgi:hypothetical protein